jgi:hypothetical protein
MVGVGLLAVAGAALWFGRGRIAGAAAAVRPRLARAGHGATIAVVRRHPLKVAKLVAQHPKPAFQLVKALH